MTPPAYIFTGGPCSGKTTLINELKSRGYSVLPEAARTVIAARLAEGKTIQEIVADPLALQHMIIAHQLELQSQAPADEVLFLDRAVPDNIAYYRKIAGWNWTRQLRGAAAMRYRKIFFLDMLEFAGDLERYETPEEAKQLHEGIRRTYEDQAYEIIDVPVMPVPERVEFVLARLD